MKQIIQNYRTGELKIEEVPLPIVKNGGVLVRNHYSVISAGTERATLEVSKKGYIGKAKERPEQVKQVIQIAKKQGLKKTFDLVMAKLNTPVPLGYSSSGMVIDVGKNVSEFQAGDRVACAGAGYANHAEVIFVPKNLCVSIPPDVAFEEAAYTTLGAIALQGVRQAEVRLGETVGVIGLGLIGLLTVQLLKAAGCRVIAFDIDPFAIGNGKACGADSALDSHSDDINSIVQSFTQDIGADAVIITAATPSNEPVELAGAISRKKGRVVVVGNVGMNIPRNVYYRKELDFKISCSYGPGRYDPNYEEYGIDYPVGYVRWTEKRNMEAFLQLVNDKKIDISKITTHKFKIENADKAYEIISNKNGERFVGMLLEYDSQREIQPRVKVKNEKPYAEGEIRIGLIGAGSFAQSSILPLLKKYNDVHLAGILAAESHSSQNVAQKFGIPFCYSEAASLFDDNSINTIIIATRHNLHAPYVIHGLKSNKNIYVEKPLALTESEVLDIIRVRQSGSKDVLVGFNRRFAPFIQRCREFFANRSAPFFINYRINAGPIPPEHWIQSQEEGGGRIIGEVCHFVDLCQCLCQADYDSVFAQSVEDNKLRDSVSMTIKFDDHSVANINYLSNGDKSYPKERMEVFCQNSIAVIDDFQKLDLIRGGKSKSYKSIQDKGISHQMDAWLKSLKEGKPIPVPFMESVNSTIATFMIHESLDKGQVIYFDKYSQRFFK